MTRDLAARPAKETRGYKPGENAAQLAPPTVEAGLGRSFDDPIPLPTAASCVPTLRDAANYTTRLPKREHDTFAWRAAIEALMLIPERGGDTMRPRIKIMRVLYPDEPVPTPRRKTAKKYGIVP